MDSKGQFKVAILAKSNKRRNNKKDYGYCVAGIDESGKWIRFVADNDGDSLPEDVNIKVGQVILANGKRAPLTHQIENVVLDDFCVTKETVNQYVGSLTQVDEVGIFGSTDNQLTAIEMRNVNGTLRLIGVSKLEVYWEGSVDLKCKARYEYNGTYYDGMSMTDPSNYTKKGSAPKQIGKAHIVVSLPEQPPYIKFVAAIFPQRKYK